MQMCWERGRGNCVRETAKTKKLKKSKKTLKVKTMKATTI